MVSYPGEAGLELVSLFQQMGAKRNSVLRLSLDGNSQASSHFNRAISFHGALLYPVLALIVKSTEPAHDPQ